jgi:hypothetical protein
MNYSQNAKYIIYYNGMQIWKFSLILLIFCRKGGWVESQQKCTAKIIFFSLLYKNLMFMASKGVA